VNQFIEPKPRLLTFASWANIDASDLEEVRTMLQQIERDLNTSFDRTLNDIPLGIYADVPTVNFYESDTENRNMIKIVKQSKLRRVENLRELLFPKTVQYED